MSVLVDLLALWAILVLGLMAVVFLASCGRQTERGDYASAGIAGVLMAGCALSAWFIARAAFL